MREVELARETMYFPFTNRDAFGVGRSSFASTAEAVAKSVRIESVCMSECEGPNGRELG